MATDFKAPKKFLFDHYLSSDGTVVSSDEIRKLFLNSLIYKESASVAKSTNDLILNQVIGMIKLYCELVQENDKSFTLRLRVDPSTISGNGHSLLITKFQDLVQQADASGIEMYQDYNFEPEGIEHKDSFSLSVRTVARELQKTDISSNDDFFTGGELNPDKDETTLKFAYAFKTTKVDGELEFISKQTKLATNYQDWQVKADNEKELPKDPISKLQNLIYFTNQTDSIEKNIEAEGSKGDIGIDKAYNVVTIQVPPVENNISVITYTTSPATPKINGVSTKTIQEGVSQYDAAILDYFLSELDGISLSNTKTKGLITGIANYIVRYYGFTVNDAASFRDNPANSDASIKEQLSLYNERIAKQKSLKEQLATAVTSFLADSSLKDYEKYFDSLKSTGGNTQFPIFTQLSTPFNFDKFSAKTFAVENPQNVTMANLFKGAMPVDNLAKGYSYGSVQDNLIRRGRLVGLKLVKSKQPLDPNLYQNWLDSIVQTYHIPIRLKEDSQQVRIFDSQIIYGKTYYYTLLGVYNVDGKFYYYDNLNIETEKQPPVPEQEKIITEAIAQGGKFQDGDYPNGLPWQLFNVSDAGTADGTYTAKSGKHKFILRLETPPREETVTELRKKEEFRSDGSSEIIETTKTQTVLITQAIIFYLIEQDPAAFNGFKAKALGSLIPDDNFNQFVWDNQGIKNDIGFEYDVNFSSENLITLKLINKIEQKEFFKNFSFDLFETNSSRIFELPLQPSLEVDNIDVAPLPPIVEFVPLADINNRIKIKFQESAASGFTIVQVDEAVKILNGDFYQKIDKKSKEEADLNGLVLDKQELLASSEGDIKEIYAFKLDRVPTSLQDLIDNGERFILDYKSGKTAYFSNVLPNEKYYYTFVSRDVTGLFSTATETFQVEIVEDSGYIYTKIDLYDYVTKEIKVTTKEFQKLLKIKPSFKQMLPNEKDGKQKLGTNELYSQYNFGGKSDTQPPRFKIRIKSKKTNRVFDINLKYSQDIKEITSKKLIEQLKKVSELVDQKKVKKNN